MKVWVTPIGKLIRPEEVLAKSEGDLKGVVGEASDEHQGALRPAATIIHPLAIVWQISPAQETIQNSREAIHRWD